MHQDKALENISIAYRSGELIADQLVPTVPVQHESDKYYVYDNDTMSLPETLRANGSRSNRASFNVSTSTYIVEEHALNDVVTMRDRNNADKAMNPEIDITEVLTKKILIRKEYECAQVVQNSANWSNNASMTSTYAWTANTTLSNPITQIDSATTKILGSSGYRPNVLVIDHKTFVGAKEHISITDRIKYTSADSVTEPMLAKMFGVAKVLVGSAIYEGADEGLTSSMQFIWTSCAFLAYMEPSAGLKKASAMYNFQTLNGTSPFKVMKWDEPELGEGTIKIEVSTMFKYAPIATACAYLIKGTAT
jgi:hypothetical protein